MHSSKNGKILNSISLKWPLNVFKWVYFFDHFRTEDITKTCKKNFATFGTNFVHCACLNLYVVASVYQPTDRLWTNCRAISVTNLWSSMFYDYMYSTSQALLLYGKNLCGHFLERINPRQSKMLPYFYIPYLLLSSHTPLSGKVRINVQCM